MVKPLPACIAVPSILFATTLAAHADPAPSVDAMKPTASAYVIDYQLADASGRTVQSGSTILSRRHPLQMGTSFVRVSYVASCSPDSGVITNEPKCSTEMADIGNSFRLALADARHDALTLTAWIDRQTLDGMQTIQNDGFATQRPLTHGWSDSKTMTVAPGGSATVELHERYKLTLHASIAGQ